MSDVGEIRALLAAFATSPWREVHLRSGDWSLFMGKPGAGANPLREAVALTASETVNAPHLGTFATRRKAGERIAANEVIGTLHVLDTAEEVRAPITGTLADVPGDGALVEYGAPLAVIAA